MLKLSPSKILTYSLCPFKYKCEINTQIRLAYKKDTPDLVFGQLIHGCLNDFFKRINEDERTFDTLCKLFEAKFKANWGKHKFVFKTKDNIIKYVKESKKQFYFFISSIYSKGNPLLLEDFPKFSLNPELELGGKFDRVDLDNEELILIDYKTGKLKEKSEKDFTFQLNFYEYLLYKKYPQYKLKNKILIFLKEDKVIEYRNSKDLISIEKEILEKAKEITEDTKLNPRPNSLCRFCDYYLICPINKDRNT